MQCDQNNLSHNEVFVELYDEAQLCSIDYERKKGENICNVKENPIHIIFATWEGGVGLNTKITIKINCFASQVVSQVRDFCTLSAMRKLYEKGGKQS